VVREITADRAVDAGPAWSPDGRYVIFSSDRSGIPNLFAADLQPEDDSVRLFQVTNVLTGAFDPDVSPDGRWLYFAAYHWDSYHMTRIPFDPSTWRDPEPLDARSLIAERAAPAGFGAYPASDAAAATGAPAAGESRPYSPWPTLRPRAWEPLWYDEGGDFIG